MFHQTIKKWELSFIANVSCSIKTQLCFLLLGIKQILKIYFKITHKYWLKHLIQIVVGKPVIIFSHFSEYSNGFKTFCLMTHILLLRLSTDNFFNSSPSLNVRTGKVCSKSGKGSPQKPGDIPHRAEKSLPLYIGTALLPASMGLCQA